MNRWSGFKATPRAAWFDGEAALDHAGGLNDTAAGHRKYGECFAWLAADEPARKVLNFDTMSQGWIVGSTGYVNALLADQKDAVAQRQLEQASKSVQREEYWREQMDTLLRRLQRDSGHLAKEGKFVDWKVAVAAAMKARTAVTNRWLAENLLMGSLHEVSRKVSAWTKQPDLKLNRKLK